MMKEPERPPLPPFAGFHVETETKADGRLVHYYGWSPGPATAAPAVGSEGAGDTGDGDEPQRVDDQSAVHDDGAPRSREPAMDTAPPADGGRAGV